MNPAIVVNGYNRPHALARLLSSLQAAYYPASAAIPLVISLDDARRHPEVVSIAQRVAWPHGPLEIICREERLGLLAHFYACGDLSANYGAIVYLEDDLYVSPVFYPYVSQALAFYQDDPRIAGISLYGLWFNGYTKHPFAPYLDEADVFFLQLPYNQGEAFTASQWGGFRLWQQENGFARATAPVHPSWAAFPPDDWFPTWAGYTMETGRFFVYPRASLATGFGDAGQHFTQGTDFLQVPLQQEKSLYRLKPFDESGAVYDSFFEILPGRLDRLTEVLHGTSYTVDLNATHSKEDLATEFVLTTRPCRRPIFTFGKAMQPLEANVAHSVPGKGISFCRVEDVQWGSWAGWRAQESNRRYFWRGQPPGLRSWARSKLAEWLF